MSTRKYLRVELAPTDLSHLVCIGCGRFNVDLAIVNGDDVDEPQAGIHKGCIHRVKAKRGAP